MKIIGKGNEEILTLDDYKKYAPPKKADFEQYMRERPSFIMQIQSIEELKNNIANPFHHFR